jgi:oligosaccharide repeat unit polymerase
MYEIDDKLLAIFYSLLMLAVAVGVRLIVGTFLIPAGIFALAWFCFTFFPLVVLFSVPINSLAILYILLAVFVFALSCVPFDWSNALKSNKRKSFSNARFDSRFMKNVLYFSLIMSVVLSVVTMLINGFAIDQVIFNPVQTSGQYAAIRGKDGLEYGFIGILSIMLTYLCAVLGGLRFCATRRNWFFIISISPSIVIMITQSSKLVFLVGLCFYSAGAIISKMFTHRMGLIELSGLLKITFLGGILFILTLISFASRLGELDFNNLEILYSPLIFSISSYILGQTYAFADFFSHTINFPSASVYRDEFYSFGAFTFGSIFDMLGMGKEFPPGMYEESAWHLDVFETNIFTFFRGLIYDFGVIGSLVFLLFFGVFSHAITYYALTKRQAWFFLAAFIVTVVFIFMGYLFSIFVARYALLVGAVTWLIFLLNARLHRALRF